ncbi:DUF4023 family protein [Alteribacter keqinensis]|uniref:DUF4023 domain-containing protein n=1 Tax=Alteribacter keqinensis TaxID=2483800 RepID=A0A3M7TUN5_9BACI|nr:DUF4023 family protein [Alteribacter keqinensis]RNA69358.1 DUF4023 domain-containing protein [Alteribacter keqinensis]
MTDTHEFVEQFNQRKEKTERNNKRQGKRDHSHSLPSKKNTTIKNTD